MSDIYVYLLERESSDSVHKIIVDAWDSVIDCLSRLDGSSDQVRIVRMRVCSKNDEK